MVPRRWVPILAALVTTAGVGMIAAGGATSAAPLYQPAGVISLPDGFDDIAVDAATQRVFVASRTSNTVTVLTDDGDLVGAISVPGAGALLLDGPRLYVAATTAGRIDSFSTVTLEAAGSIGSGGLSHLGTIVKAGGRLWTTTGACGGGVRLVSIDPATAGVTTHSSITDLSYCPRICSNPARPDTLMGFDAGLSPTTVVRLDVSTGAPVVTGSIVTDSGSDTTGAFLPDATFVLGGNRTFSVDTLRPTGVHYTDSDAIAIEATLAAGGLVGVSRSAGFVHVSRLGHDAQLLFAHTFAASNSTLAGGLAFSSDGSTLYVVSGDRFRGTATLNLFGPVDPGSQYTPLTPARILDTRTGAGGLAGSLGPASTVQVQVTGRGGVPTAGVNAVAMNVTVTRPTAAGYLTIYPSGGGRPLAANLNFTPGQTVPNLVVVKVGAGGNVSMFNSSGATDVIFDVAGYYTEPGTTSTPSGGGRYAALLPARILDTRTGTGGGVRLAAGATLDLQVSGRGGVPAHGAAAVVVNVAATGTTATSFLTVHPTGEPRPWAANLNFTAGDTVSSRAMVKLGAGGRITIYNNAGATDVVIDVGGWFSDASVTTQGGEYTPLMPARILDTRDYMNGIAPKPADEWFVVSVAGRAGVPLVGATAVVLNVTVVDAAGPGWLTMYPVDNTARPLASDLNYAAGETRANLAVVQLDGSGMIDVFISAGGHVVIDVAGWIS